MDNELIISDLENHLSFADNVSMVTISDCNNVSDVALSHDDITYYKLNILYYDKSVTEFDTDDIKERIISILGDAFIALIYRHNYSYIILVDWKKYNINEDINHDLLKIKNTVEQIEYVDSCKVSEYIGGVNYNGKHLRLFNATAIIPLCNDYQYVIDLLVTPRSVLADLLNIDTNMITITGVHMFGDSVYLDLKVYM